MPSIRQSAQFEGISPARPTGTPRLTAVGIARQVKAHHAWISGYAISPGGPLMRDLLLRLRRHEDAARPPHAWLGALGGCALLALSLVFIVGGAQLGLGSPRRLGTGAFPAITGMALALLSLAVIAADLRDTSDAERPDWISFAAIGGALAIFALTAGRIGLVPGVFLTTITASLPDPSLRFPGKVILAALVALGCWGLFIGLIGLPFAAFGGV